MQNRATIRPVLDTLSVIRDTFDIINHLPRYREGIN